MVYRRTVRYVYSLGLYALPGRHEWVKQRERLTTEQYEKYFNNFDPDQFDPANGRRKLKLRV
ncbi:hypothetical protein LWM68_09850 [Niabella sp. W65]|nr:hypothetical protein [Niabella sp. W65]MCH7363044.1 hypothetical protein [Niabella sp. W65]ULT46660.1 hypothetical protein KRR40_28535 [Niabella sp. I65]